MRTHVPGPLVVVLAALGLSAFGLASSSWLQGHEDDDETPIETSKLPAAVQATARSVFGTLDGLKATREEEHGAVMFEVEGKGAGGMEVSFTCPTSGEIHELEREVAVSSLPGDAANQLQRAFPGATILSVCSVEKHFFEVKLQKDGKKREAIVSVAGRVRHDEEGEEGEEGEDEEGGR